MSIEPLPQSEIILYQTEDGRTRVQCRFENETVWLTQKLMADLFQIGVGTVNHHLKAIFAEGELESGATIRRYRIVQNEGGRQIAREVEHYNLDAILAVGFRVRSHRGTQFTEILIPLPPLAEQAAIVARVEALLGSSRLLAAEIAHTRTHAAHLLQAVLKEAFTPAT